ncbi:MAG TPA: PQQ-binding-like beta-propeller repeat protein [Fimbriimonas sp.]|nr:PQQ-binding-like beta-propeller repeat protein [Fimbriimonas sp.]
MSAKHLRQGSLLALFSILAIHLLGCGGSAGQAAGGKGQVQLSIAWPARKTNAITPKYIPGYAGSLFFELYPKGYESQVATLIVNRPSSSASTQDVQFDGLFNAGTYELIGAARAQSDAQGATVAAGATEITVKPGMNPVKLVLSSTVKSLKILGTPISVGVGQKVTLQSGAFDPDGASLLLPDGALTWSVVSGGSFGTLTAGGSLTGKAIGTMTVKVMEPVTKVSATATVSITSTTVSSELAKTGYSRPSGNLSGTGAGGGSGATGKIDWTYSMGSRGVGTPVLGNGNVLFAISQDGKVHALSTSSGSVVWEQSLPSFSGQLAFGSLAVSDDNVLYVGCDAGTYAFDANTGIVKWSDVDFGVVGNINLYHGVLYVPSVGFGMGVIDAHSGTTIKEFPGLQYTYDATIANGKLYYATEQVGAGRTAALYAIDLTSGATLWTDPITIPPGGGYEGGPPVVESDGTMLINLGDGNLSAISGTTGAIIKSVPSFSSAAINPPAIAPDGSIIFSQRPSTSFGTASYTSTLGTKKWFSGTLLRAPTIASDGTVYGTFMDNTDGLTYMYALGPTDGKLKWRLALDKGQPAAPPGWGLVPGYTAIDKDGHLYVVSIDQLVYAVK